MKTIELLKLIETITKDADDDGEALVVLEMSLEEASMILSALKLKTQTEECGKKTEFKVNIAATTDSPFNKTVDLMLSADYKQRFKAEYLQTKIRYERLKLLNTKIEAAHRVACEKGKELEMPPHDCPDMLLQEQQSLMGQYLRMLELRAVIEDIDLT